MTTRYQWLSYGTMQHVSVPETRMAGPVGSHVAHVPRLLRVRHVRDTLVYAVLVRYCHGHSSLTE